jgi:hypothetical protein
VNFTNALRIAQVPHSYAGGLALLFFVACGSGSRMGTGMTEPVGNPEETISLFMAAVKAEDLAGMSRLWGTKDGPVVDRMDPVAAQRRLRLMQIYLAHDNYTAVLDDGQMFANTEREVHYKVTLSRKNCRPIVPFKLVKAGSTWLVENVNLSEAGNPAPSC